jgi:hypothetical protein
MKILKTFRRTLFYPLILISLCNCESATKQELEAITELNNKYKDYTFSSGPGLVGTHLDVQVPSNWDSLQLKVIYDSSIGAYKNVSGIPWVYLNVYNKNDDYLFTISKDSKGHNFFKE